LLIFNASAAIQASVGNVAAVMGAELFLQGFDNTGAGSVFFNIGTYSLWTPSAASFIGATTGQNVGFSGEPYLDIPGNVQVQGNSGVKMPVSYQLQLNVDINNTSAAAINAFLFLGLMYEVVGL
jgi:hypothetical protein